MGNTHTFPDPDTLAANGDRVGFVYQVDPATNKVVGPGGGGAITAAAGSYVAGALVDGASVTQGSTTDTAATTDTGTFSLMAFIKRLMQKLPNIGPQAKAASMSITVATDDGNIGTSTDAAVVGDVNGSVSAKLRGQSKILNAVWDSVNNLLAVNVKQFGGQAPTLDNTTIQAVSMRGKGAGTAGDTALLLNSDGSLQADLRKVLGSALSLSNPVITEDQIRAAVIAGQAYQASVFQTTASGITVAAALVNLSTSGKNVLIYSVKEFQAGGLSNFTVRLQTSDPALSSTVTPANNKPGGAAAAASFEYSNTTQTASGTTIDNINSPSNTETQILQNGSCIYFPSGSTNALVLYPVISGASNWGVTIKWIEF